MDPFPPELAHAFAGVGTVEVEIDGQTVQGFLDEVIEEEADGSGGFAQREATVVHLLRADAGGLAFGQEIVVDGKTRKVRRVLPEHDGAMAAVQLVTVLE